MRLSHCREVEKIQDTQRKDILFNVSLLKRGTKLIRISPLLGHINSLSIRFQPKINAHDNFCIIKYIFPL